MPTTTRAPKKKQTFRAVSMMLIKSQQQRESNTHSHEMSCLGEPEPFKSAVITQNGVHEPRGPTGMFTRSLLFDGECMDASSTSRPSGTNVPLARHFRELIILRSFNLRELEDNREAKLDDRRCKRPHFCCIDPPKLSEVPVMTPITRLVLLVRLHQNQGLVYCLTLT